MTFDSIEKTVKHHLITTQPSITEILWDWNGLEYHQEIFQFLSFKKTDNIIKQIKISLQRPETKLELALVFLFYFML